MKQAKTTKQPLGDSKEYVIVANIEDHVGYKAGDIVKKIEELPNNYFIVKNGNGQEWQVGEEEIKEHSKEGLHTQGEWKVSHEAEPDLTIWAERKIADGTTQNECVATVWATSNTEANAELIVKAVNFYNKLPRLLPDANVPLPNDEYFLKAVNERQALLDALKKAMSIIDRMDDEFRSATNRHSSYTRGEYNSLNDVVNRNQ